VIYGLSRYNKLLTVLRSYALPVSHDDMKNTLNELGCRTVHQVKKVFEYMMPGTKEPFYVHRENVHPQIVIRPALEVFLDKLDSIDGVLSKDPYYHNADMSRFPSRLHGGKKEVHYGLAFEFENSLAVEKFINEVISIVRHS
jgi:hypothetical protein